jgi:hypothetical protein
MKDGKVSKVSKFVLPNKNKQAQNKQANPPVKCGHCHKDRSLHYNCEIFKALTVKDRYKSVKENQLCIRCLAAGHYAKDCRGRHSCAAKGCTRRHNTLLHPEAITKTMLALFGQQGCSSDLDSDTEYSFVPVGAKSKIPN